METIDDETCNAAVDFIQRQTRANKPFFVWWNGTRMHLYTHVRPENRGKSGVSEYFDGMLEHDGHVGQLLKALDDLGIANDTIVVYSTDNGPHMNSWPDGAMTPFRGEKNTNWEGAFRVPAMVRWPGRIRAGAVSNDIVSALDWFPTLVAAAGDSGVKDLVRQRGVAGVLRGAHDRDRVQRDGEPAREECLVVGCRGPGEDLVRHAVPVDVAHDLERLDRAPPVRALTDDDAVLLVLDEAAVAVEE